MSMKDHTEHKEDELKISRNEPGWRLISLYELLKTDTDDFIMFCSSRRTALDDDDSRERTRKENCLNLPVTASVDVASLSGCCCSCCSCCWCCSAVFALLWFICRNPAFCWCDELVLATSDEIPAVNLPLPLDSDEETPGRHNDRFPAAVGWVCTDNITPGSVYIAAAAALNLSGYRRLLTDAGLCRLLPSSTAFLRGAAARQTWKWFVSARTSQCSQSTQRQCYGIRPTRFLIQRLLIYRWIYRETGGMTSSITWAT